MFINSICLIMHTKLFRISLSAPLFTTNLLLSPGLFCHLRIYSTENRHLELCAKKLSALFFHVINLFLPCLVPSPWIFKTKSCYPIQWIILLPLPLRYQDYKHVSSCLAPSYQYTMITYVDILVFILGLFNLILQFVGQEIQKSKQQKKACSEKS